MEAPVRVMNRSLFSNKSTSTTTNFLKPVSLIHRSIPSQRQNLQTHIISLPRFCHSRIHSSFSPFSHSPVTPNPNPINFFLSLSSSYLSNPTKNSDFNFKSHQNERPFTWNKAPESAVRGKVSVFSDEKTVVTVVLLGWLGAREKHLRKYVEWYNSRGIHAVKFNFKSHQNERPFTWNKAPESAVRGKVSVFSDEKTVVTVVLLGWLGAREKHLRKYVEWYNSRGIHAVKFVVDMRELLCFDLGKGVEKRIAELANQLVSWVSEREDDGRERCLVFHTFSNTGWLVYGYILRLLQERKELMEKIKGCVSDSGGGNQFNPKFWAGGFSTALMKKSSSSVQVIATKEINGLENQASESKEKENEPSMIEAMVLNVFEMLFSVILKLPEVDQKLTEIVSMLSEKQPSCPHLFLYSTADKLVPFHLIEFEIQDQRRMGRKVISYNFETSPHVDHFRTFPDMYSSLLHNFLKECFPVVKQI